MRSSSPLENALVKLNKLLARYALPLTGCLVFGLLAYLFVFTNKLLNLDEIAGLFRKGSL